MPVTVPSNVPRLVFRSFGRPRVGNGIVSVTVPSNVPRLVFRSVGRARVGSGIVKAGRRRGENGVARIGNWEGGG